MYASSPKVKGGEGYESIHFPFQGICEEGIDNVRCFGILIAYANTHELSKLVDSILVKKISKLVSQERTASFITGQSPQELKWGRRLSAPSC